MSSGTQRIRAVAFFVFVLGILRYAPVIDEPWSHSFGDMNSTEYTTRFVRTFERVGFDGTRGVPHFWALPVEGAVAWGPYRHHPPMHSWMIWAMVKVGGFNEPACRSAPILLSALAFALMAWLVGTRLGALVACATGLLGLSLPMGYQFGWMVNPESAVLGFSMLAVALHVRFRTASWSRYSSVCAAQFLAFQMDWQGAFFGLAIVLHEAFSPRAERRLARTFIGIVGAGILSGLLSIRVLAGNLTFTDSATFLRDLSTNETSEPLDWGLWWSNQGMFWTELMGWPAAVLSAAALPLLVRAATRPDGALERLTCALALPGVLNVVAFTRHSIDHEFWWFYVLPYVVMAPAVALRRLGVPRQAIAVLLLAVAGHAAWLTTARHRELRTDEFLQHARSINSVVGPDDYLVTPVSMGRAGFYLDAWVFDSLAGMKDVEQVRATRAFMDAGMVVVDRVIFVVPRGYPTLAREDVRDLGTIEEMGDGGFRLVMER